MKTLHRSKADSYQLVLSKDTAILGYPGEVSKSMDADHHNVCKYTSQHDSNYIIVRNALNTLVSRFRAAGSYARLRVLSRHSDTKNCQ